MPQVEVGGQGEGGGGGQGAGRGLGDGLWVRGQRGDTIAQTVGVELYKARYCVRNMYHHLTTYTAADVTCRLLGPIVFVLCWDIDHRLSQKKTDMP